LILVDENILDGQRLLLEAWGIPVRQIGVDLGRKGLQDEEIIVLLRKLRKPTFFTRDMGFFRRDLCHRGYAIAILSVGQYEVATFVRRLLRHHGFDTQAKRMGKVIRLSPTGVACWRLGHSSAVIQDWIDQPQ
jgi:hypothetical protein